MADTDVSYILDLTEAADFLPSYKAYLKRGAILYFACPLERFQAPDEEHLRQIIAQILHLE